MRAALRDGIYSGAIQFASRYTRPIGGQYEVVNWRWRAARVADLPGFIVRAILAEAEPHDAREDYAAGSRLVGARVDELKAAHVHDAFDEDAVRERALSIARHAARLESLAAREVWARAHHIEPPAENSALEPKVDAQGRFRRLACERWWRRQVRKCWTRRSEDALRGLGFICRSRAPYVSDPALAAKAAQRQNAAQYLKRHVLVNELGEQLELLGVAERSIANPAIRRGELMTRAKGFELIAGQLGHAGLFVTLTCPSAFHARHASGAVNDKWTRAAVRAGQAWLCRQWARARAKLKRCSVNLYGFRVAEPHHDGTPHWHLLIFTAPANVRLVQRVLRGYWLSEYAEEKGAKRHRVKFRKIDAAKGDAAGYLAKYVAKNLDAAGSIAAEPDDESNLSGADAAERVRAWASLHGIRQFQQVGGPPVGIWREARRLRDPVADADLERARRAADLGDWAEFIRCVTDGPYGSRKTNLRLHREETGELNGYGEPRGARIVGLAYASTIEITRPHIWSVKPCWHFAQAPCSVPSVSDSGLSLESCSRIAIARSTSASTSALTPSARSRMPGYRLIFALPSPPHGSRGNLSSTMAEQPKHDSGIFSAPAPQARRLGPVAITVRDATARDSGARSPPPPARPDPTRAALEAWRIFAAVPLEAENPWIATAAADDAASSVGSGGDADDEAGLSRWGRRAELAPPPAASGAVDPDEWAREEWERSLACLSLKTRH